jgi:NAD+ diphosphatase
MGTRDYQFCPLCRKALIERPHGGQQRAACPDTGCGFVHWRNPVPVVASIVERDGHVVLVRSRGAPAGWFGLVAGFLERGETPEAGARREVDEEIGLAGDAATLIGVYPFVERNQIIFVYHMHARDGPIRLCHDELSDYQEVSIECLRPWPRGTGPGLRDWLVSRGYNPPIAEFGTPQPRRD